MEQLISYCGLVCSTCPAFIATRDNDNVKRKQTAEEWSKQFKSEIKPEDIDCRGCVATEGKLFNYCMVCEIRKCGVGKKVENCGACPDYACEKLTAFFKMAPSAKQNLDEVRKKTKK